MSNESTLYVEVGHSKTPPFGHSSILNWISNKGFEPLFHIYVYLLVLLPTGSLFGINIKFICFFLLFPIALSKHLADSKTTLSKVSLLFVVPGALLVWILIAQVYEANAALSYFQFKDIATTFASCWLVSVFCRNRKGADIRFLRTVLIAEIVACLIKITLLGYCFYKEIPVSLMIDSISDFFGTKLMSMDLDSALGRIQFVADGLIPICIYMLLRYRTKLKISSVSAVVMFFLLAVSLVFTFSRYFWGFAALAFSLGMIFSKKDHFHASVITLLCIVLLVSLPVIVDLYQIRFSDAIAGGSDSVRTEQIPALERFFLDAPLLGHGYGSYTPDVIRSSDLQYGYEVQLYALAGQEGIIGLLLMGVLLLLYYYPLLWSKGRFFSSHRFGLIIILFGWLAAGLFNPMLFNSAAAMSYAAINALSEISSESGLMSTLKSFET
ncbi:O-antigen ligase family protein [Tunturiibacter empetritectus]|uniref:O-antigen ligase-related domain-containing protein n=2 Tax=Tunturiibacter TaxID=3154218 RepID=A0A852VHW9_9BACT|nr:O-antigen ligase family protein [Edaphobacter lichenicola]NYF91230.1 hypothetical protein [Edaphobacter lichenicola]